MKTWNELTYEEKMNEVATLNETYNFSDYSDAETAAWNVRQGYENDPDFFNFEVSDIDAFEADLKDLIQERYFTL